MRFGLLIIFLLVLIFLSLSWGSAGFMPLYELVYQQDSLSTVLFYNNRLPRTLLALFAGSGAAIAGLLLQTLFKNPLAGPTTLGINSGASLGVASYYYLISIGVPLLAWATPALFATFGSLGFLLLILLFSRRFESVYTLLIVGLLLGYLAYAIVELLIQYSSDGGIRSYVFWGMGSFNGGSYFQILILVALVAVTTAYAWMRRETLNLYLLGEEELRLRGKSQVAIQLQILLLSGLLVGVSTSIVGPIAFIGVIAPNLLKFLIHSLDHRKLIGKVVLLGGVMALLADILSRGIVFSQALPLNSILSLMSIPILLLLLKKPSHVN